MFYTEASWLAAASLQLPACAREAASLLHEQHARAREAASLQPAAALIDEAPSGGWGLQLSCSFAAAGQLPNPSPQTPHPHTRWGAAASLQHHTDYQAILSCKEGP